MKFTSYLAALATVMTLGTVVQADTFANCGTPETDVSIKPTVMVRGKRASIDGVVINILPGRPFLVGDK